MAILVERESLTTKSRHVSPSYVDKDGVSNLSSSDRPFPTVDVNHLRLHEGRAYYAYKLYPDAAKLGAGTSANIAVAFGAGTFAHIIFDAICGGDAEFYVYENATVTGGTSFTALRRNRLISSTSNSAILINPTVSNAGTEIDGQFLAGGTGKKSGGSNAFTFEYVLNPLTTYLIQLTNVNGTSHMAHLMLEWYE